MSMSWHRNRNLSKDEYLMNFNESVKPAQTEKDSKIENAYRQAAEIRKFEIELFWKRAGYFWAFIVSIYAAFSMFRKNSTMTNVLALSTEQFPCSHFLPWDFSFVSHGFCLVTHQNSGRKTGKITSIFWKIMLQDRFTKSIPQENRFQFQK